MTTYVEVDGAVTSEECLYFCSPGWPVPCEAPECRCDCHNNEGSDDDH